MADQDDIEIEIPADGEAPPETPKVEGEKPAREEVPALEALKKQLDDERRARLAAESDARTARQEVTRAGAEVQDANVALVTNAVTTVQGQINEAKRRIVDARNTGDIDTEMEATVELARLGNRLETLEQGAERVKQQPRPQSPAPQVDAVEALASQLSPRSAQWVRNHPEYATDARKNAKMKGAHQLAIGDGLEPDTDEYFAYVERTIGIDTPVTRHDREEREPRRQSSPPSAPPSRSSTPGAGQSRVVRLSADERDMAKAMGMTDQEYAANKLALQKEGKLN